MRLRQERIQAICAEEELWQKRIANAREQIATLRAREEETSADLAALANLPAEIEARRGKLLDAIAIGRARARQGGRRSCGRRDRAETIGEGFARGAGAAWPKHAKRARGARRGLSRRASAAARSRTRSASSSTACRRPACALAALKQGAAVPPQVEVEARLQKLKGDRERLGGVNLRAEEEEAELSAKLEEMEREKADVEEAIARLRQGISNLNREGRKRLLEAFDTVNGHFQRLFKTLVRRRLGRAQAGRVRRSARSRGSRSSPARLARGRRSLTLLSGGEKALTALALIFAVFLTNPSPICVLDEVDAPLDDANVDRFCLLMEEMARSTDTRFLIITHHPLTMARMSRLFGVTMSERGVSQLVSVDLGTAERLRDAS